MPLLLWKVTTLHQKNSSPSGTGVPVLPELLGVTGLGHNAVPLVALLYVRFP